MRRSLPVLVALAATGPPAGLLPETTYESQPRRLAIGDVIVLVPDGVTEAIEGGGEVEEHLAETVALRVRAGILHRRPEPERPGAQRVRPRRGMARVFIAGA
jgi:hypothetical protein